MENKFSKIVTNINVKNISRSTFPSPLGKLYSEETFRLLLKETENENIFNRVLVYLAQSAHIAILTQNSSSFFSSLNKKLTLHR